MAFYEAMQNVPNLFRFSRRVEHSDVPTVMNLFRDKVTKELFGNVNVSELIEMAYLSLAQLDSSSSGIVACLFLCDFPNVPAVPRGCWVDWLRQHYRLEQASAGNTLFVHLLVWEPSHTHQFLRPLLCSVFLECPRLRNIVVVVPPGARKYDILDEFFTQIVPQPAMQHARVQTVLLCMRQQLVQRLKVRRAVEEDNDDLMPILDKTGRLKEQFGEFYVSDLIRTSDETRKMIVPEVLERAVGVMCVSSSVDYAQLDELFELGPFNGLKRSSALPVKPPVTRVCADADDQFNDGSEESLVRHSDPDPSLDENALASLELSQEPSREFSYEPSQELSQESSWELSQEPSKDPSWKLSQEPSKDSSRKFSQEPSQEWSQESSWELSQELSQESSWELSQEPSQELNRKLSREPTRELSQDVGPVSEHRSTISDLNIEVRMPDVSATAGDLPNAFMIEVFALHEDVDERFSLDMLEAAFDCFADLDYCIATLPSAYTLRPLLEHFVRVPTKTVCSARTELCVAHRNSFLSEMVVRRATLGDIPSLRALLGRIEKWYEILADVMTSLRRAEAALRSFVITSEESVVGLAVIRGGEDVSYLWARYQLERCALRKAHAPEQHGLVRHLVLSPAFNYHARFFLAEVHRQSDVTCLYAPLPHHPSSQVRTPLQQVLGSPGNP